MSDLTTRIIGAESGGNPNSVNPRSSAAGAGQFIASTWLQMMTKYRPDLTANRSPNEILAMRSDPELSRQMTAAYAQENGRALQGAGYDATPGNTYLAHFAGPHGAVGVLGADPATPVGTVLGANVVRANPFLANMTAGDLINWANRKMGAPAPLSASAPASQPLSLLSAQSMALNPTPNLPLWPSAPAAAPAPAPSSFFATLPANPLQRMLQANSNAAIGLQNG